jgi:hypothetical protein
MSSYLDTTNNYSNADIDIDIDIDIDKSTVVTQANKKDNTSGGKHFACYL